MMSDDHHWIERGGEDNCSSCLGKETVNPELMSRINRFLMKDTSDQNGFLSWFFRSGLLLMREYFVQRF